MCGFVLLGPACGGGGESADLVSLIKVDSQRYVLLAT